MYKTLKISIASIASIASALALILALQSTNITVRADDGPHNEDGTHQEDEKKDETKAEYKYKVQAGDSYTLLARKAVQTYGIVNKVDLTKAGIVYAETKITADAKAGELEVGQEVTVDANDIKKYVESADKLTKTEQNAWGVYVKFVNFNTDKVGQDS